MTVMLERDIVGSGADALVGTNNLLFIAVQVTAVGGDARPLEVTDPDHYLRLGWFSVGDNFSVGVGPLTNWWRAPVWVDFLDFLWTPIPSGNGAGPLFLQATQFRWSLTLGTEAHVLVFGT